MNETVHNTGDEGLQLKKEDERAEEEGDKD